MSIPGSWLPTIFALLALLHDSYVEDPFVGGVVNTYGVGYVAGYQGEGVHQLSGVWNDYGSAVNGALAISSGGSPAPYAFLTGTTVNSNCYMASQNLGAGLPCPQPSTEITQSAGVLHLKNTQLCNNNGGGPGESFLLLQSAGTLFYDDGGNVPMATNVNGCNTVGHAVAGITPIHFNVNVGAAIAAIADGRMGSGSCGTLATGSNYMYMGLDGQTSLTCTATAILGMVMQRAGTIYELQAIAGTAGFSASSGVVTVVKNGTATGITCTIGTGTFCTLASTATTVTFSPGDTLALTVSTVASDTLANVKATFSWF